MTVALAWLASYLIGSIPFAFIAGRITTGLDLREHGSRNVGAANLLRTTTRATPAVLVAGLDLAKGVAAVLLARRMGLAAPALAAAAVIVVVGHVYPVWLRWHGGKGVATMFGSFLALAPIDSVWAAVVFVVVAAVARRASPASLAGTAVLAGVAWARSPRDVAVAATCAAALVWWKHRANMARLLSGTEKQLWKAE